ncbi:Metal-dependent hydrolase, endonuclease/exonuclease/phosphatase family [Chitinophaga sp. CF118]|uniref:endonuclease/exonuclease/phosphatase family protein n=1 Tax=Chitinophaga sp. CF118 TaxID=1884367 RepID=UPI0008E6EC52|nr:endonuclease/exonuclease/phosphatase family protein [Chitinophaga sp. CF118]SFD17782.1 Metal-dependent hydrolase, endonuclease/exonuclease/phosphatase family [Chitinophaga sp. CF118]
MKRWFFWVVCFGLLAYTAADAQRITVGTYNMRYDNKDDEEEGNGWKQRYPVIAGMIRFHGFDIFGTQECLRHQLGDIKNSLPGFTFIGVGRDDGKEAGEHSAIFYNTEKFKLLENGDFWLSTITDKPNKGWDAVLPRICSWGKFSDIKTGFTFYFFNLHMDHVGVQARAESSKLVLAKVKAMAGNIPVILTGDFNVDQNNESYALINNSGILKDAYETAAFRFALNGTFNSFNVNGKTDSRIDHIFLTKQFKVEKYGVLTDTYRNKNEDNSTANTGNFPKEVSMQKYTAREPSDHFPVMIVVEYKK